MSKGEKADDIVADDFAGADPKVMDLIVQESDKRVTAQVQLMLANDLRANGILAASATLAAAAYAVAGSQLGKDGNHALLVGAAVFAVFASLAALTAVWALWPKGVNIQGWSPRFFVSDVRAKKDFARVQAEIAVKNQEKINDNEVSNADLSRRIRWAMALLSVAPMAGGIALLLSTLCAAGAAPSKLSPVHAHTVAVHSGAAPPRTTANPPAGPTAAAPAGRASVPAVPSQPHQ